MIFALASLFAPIAAIAGATAYQARLSYRILHETRAARAAAELLPASATPRSRNDEGGSKEDLRAEIERLKAERSTSLPSLRGVARHEAKQEDRSRERSVAGSKANEIE